MGGRYGKLSVKDFPKPVMGFGVKPRFLIMDKTFPVDGGIIIFQPDKSRIKFPKDFGEGAFFQVWLKARPPETDLRVFSQDVHQQGSAAVPVSDNKN